MTGPNGSGKSTLAKLIMGMEKPTAGKIYFEGKDITDCSVTERARMGISYAFIQAFLNWNKHLYLYICKYFENP